ncbi:MAG: ABC transporter permease [Ilumatobacteraceae bacterium]
MRVPYTRFHGFGRSGVLTFIYKRFLNLVMLVVLASSLGYFLAATALDPRANFEGRNPPIPESTIDHKLDALNMNTKTPILERYVTWVGDVVHGDLGTTLSENSVNNEISRRIWVSLRLLLIGSILGSVLGVLVGVFSAVRQYKFFDRSFGIISFILLSTPVFLLAILLKFGAINFNNRIGTTFFYTVGEYTPELGGGTWTLLVNRLQHLILPTLSITLGGVAFYSRYQRNAMLDVLSSDHLRTARAKGLTKRQALFKHGLRVAILPMTTFFAYSFGLLITGAVFTETIFGWNGMGQWFIISVQANDVNAVSAIVLFSAVLVLLSGFIADVATAALDPRVRLR